MIKIDIEPGFDRFVPEEFRQNPASYFDNVPTGTFRHDDNECVRQNPTTVKYFPEWENENGNRIEVVAKKVILEKAQIGLSGDPFYEYHLMKKLRQVGYATAELVAKVEQDKTFLILMKRIRGYTLPFTQTQREYLKEEHHFSENDIQSIEYQVMERINVLRLQLEKNRIIRKVKIADAIVQMDYPNKQMTKVILIDWERTRVLTGRAYWYYKLSTLCVNLLPRGLQKYAHIPRIFKKEWRSITQHVMGLPAGRI